MDLLNKHCKAKIVDTDKLSMDHAKDFLAQAKNWALAGTDIKRTFVLKDFITAMLFVNEIAQIAETEQHHPDMRIYRYNRVDVRLMTHKVNGLTINDFILAANINQLVGEHFDWFVE